MTQGARCSWARRAQPEILGGKSFFADEHPLPGPKGSENNIAGYAGSLVSTGTG